MRLVLLACVAAALPACGPDPVDGGPCTYRTVAAQAVVLEVDTLGAGAVRAAVLVADAEVRAAGYPDGLRDWVAVGEGRVAVGDSLSVAVDLITEGTCTPAILDVSGLGTAG